MKYNVINFNMNSICAPFMIDGWGLLDFWGVWNSSKFCSIRVPLDSSVKISRICFTGSIVRCNIFLNGIFIGMIESDSALKVHKIEFKERIFSNEILIKFEADAEQQIGLSTLWFEEYCDSYQAAYPIKKIDCESVFICGIPRSGTTAMCSLLSYMYGYNREPPETFIFSNLANIHKLNNFQFNSMLSALPPDSVCSFKSAMADYSIEPSQQKLSECISVFVQNYLNKFSSGVFVEKTPDHCFYLDTITTYFNKPKILFMYRSPVSVFKSIKHRLQQKEDDSNNSWLLQNVDDFTKYYDSYLSSFERYVSTASSSILPVSYERLLDRNSYLLESIAKYLDIPTNRLYRLFYVKSEFNGGIVPLPFSTDGRSYSMNISDYENQVLHDYISCQTNRTCFSGLFDSRR